MWVNFSLKDGTRRTEAGAGHCNNWAMLNKFYGDITMGKVEAVAVISPSMSPSLSGDKNVWGTLQFLQNSSTGVTQVKGVIAGLTPGLHGLHVHANFGDSTKGCSSVGPHFNPLNKSHGGLSDQDRHAGDLGNINAGQNGIAEISIKDITLSGPHSILGRTIVVHAGADDLGRGGNELSKKTGNAGGRIGCGIIRPQLSF